MAKEIKEMKGKFRFFDLRKLIGSWKHHSATIVAFSHLTQWKQILSPKKREPSPRHLLDMEGHIKCIIFFYYLFNIFCMFSAKFPFKSIMINTFPLRNSSKHLLSARSHLLRVWDSDIIIFIFVCYYYYYYYY